MFPQAHNSERYITKNLDKNQSLFSNRHSFVLLSAAKVHAALCTSATDDGGGLVLGPN